MAVKITLSADKTTGAGVNFNADYARFFDAFEPYGLPWMLEATGKTETTQIVHVETPTEGSEALARAVILDGHNFKYTFENHTISGTINTISLVRLGAAYNQTTDTLNLTDGLVKNTDAVITFSGLRIVNPVGVDGKVHKIVAGMMGGGMNGTLADESPITSQIWAQAHILIGSTGDDRYAGSKFGDLVNGNGGNDTLNGRGGADTLNGGAGDDRLTGGVGADRFVFGTAGAADGDVISDFRHGQKDMISLQAMDANISLAGDQAFTYLGIGDFTNVAGQLRLVQGSINSVLEGDLNGDGQADFSITLNGKANLVASDFLL